MTARDILDPHPPEFDRFLHAPVGEDRNGSVVTVLSALARLGLDPWTETAELATLGREAARVRLERLLARFRDVPALAGTHGRVARDLSRLLPDGLPSGPPKRAAATVGVSHPGTNGAIWAVLAIMLFLVQMFVIGGAGSGE